MLRPEDVFALPADSLADPYLRDVVAECFGQFVAQGEGSASWCLRDGRQVHRYACTMWRDPRTGAPTAQITCPDSDFACEDDPVGHWRGVVNPLQSKFW